jgi:hypothetical protein
MVMADVEHRLGLVDADDFPAFDLLGQRPGHPSGAGGDVEHQLLALEREHFDQFVRQGSSDTGQPAPVEVGGVRRIVKARLVVVAVAMIVIVVVTMGMIVTVRMGMVVFVTVLVPVIGRVRMLIIMPVRITVLVAMILVVIVRVLAFVLVFVFVRHFSVFLFFESYSLFYLLPFKVIPDYSLRSSRLDCLPIL